jgi:5'-3' exoribonuclease 1
MGIPSYFSYIIRNYANIIRKREQYGKLDNFMLDSNSIIYDAYYEIIRENASINVELLEKVLIKRVIEKIEALIEYIKPEKRVMITFDGVAPMAKMQQQKKRRNKTRFMAQFEPPKQWDTTQITPGTPFMKKFSKAIYAHFDKYIKRHLNGESNIEYIVSCSDERGEGEHKIMRRMRQGDMLEDSVVIYGKDSDLIMLSICNHTHAKEVYVCREKDKREKDKDKDDEMLFVDIETLVKAIKKETKADPDDYMLICIFFGNDFMPPFAALNLRTNGYQILMDSYKKVVGDKKLMENNNINWKLLEKLFQEMGKHEQQYLIEDHKIRLKMASQLRHKKYATIQDRINDVPLHNMEVEKYIDYKSEGWQQRYRKVLNVCTVQDYIEGIEWVKNYYKELEEMEKCKIEVSPLLSEMYSSVLREKEKEKELSEKEQLSYIMPAVVVKEKYDWTQKRYFWEAIEKE